MVKRLLPSSIITFLTVKLKQSGFQESTQTIAILKVKMILDLNFSYLFYQNPYDTHSYSFSL